MAGDTCLNVLQDNGTGIPRVGKRPSAVLSYSLCLNSAVCWETWRSRYCDRYTEVWTWLRYKAQEHLISSNWVSFNLIWTEYSKECSKVSLLAKRIQVHRALLMTACCIRSYTGPSWGN